MDSTTLKAIQQEVEETLREGRKIIRYLEELGQEIEFSQAAQPRKLTEYEQANLSTYFPDQDPNEQAICDSDGWWRIPIQVKIKGSILQQYRNWYGRCSALVQNNIHNGLTADFDEMQRIHKQLVDTVPTASVYSLARMVGQGRVGIKGQRSVLAHISIIMGLIEAVPHKARIKAYDIHKALIQQTASNQLDEARVLLQAGHVRAAGALAGVVLEQHLKEMCLAYKRPVSNQNNGKPLTMDGLNQSLYAADSAGQRIYDDTQMKRIIALASIRNDCDHPNKEPTQQEVERLIQGAADFIRDHPIPTGV